jgi:hypothetical protein
MDAVLSEDAIRRIRLRSQQLEPRNESRDVASIVARVFGIQAQEVSAANIGIQARSRGLTIRDIDQSRFSSRSIIRTWCMRGTLHYLASEDVFWLLSLCGSTFVSRSRKRLNDLGFNDNLAETAIEIILDSVKKHGPQTRTEIIETLLNHGISFDRKGQAPYHLIRRAALLGHIYEAAPKGKEEAFGLLGDWVDLKPLEKENSMLHALAHRYLSAYQPATIEDLSSWSKLPMRRLRKAWATLDPITTEVTSGKNPMKMLTKDLELERGNERPSVRLLPAFDNYLLGYSNRKHAVSNEDEPRIWPGGGIIRPTVIYDGRVIATWKFGRHKKRSFVLITPFDTIHPDINYLLGVEVNELSRFLGKDYNYENI